MTVAGDEPPAVFIGLPEADNARSRCHFRLKQVEGPAQSYRDKLADLESRIRAIDGFDEETEASVNIKLVRWTFAVTLFLACLAALGIATLALEDL
jgi:hypothetical protein